MTDQCAQSCVPESSKVGRMLSVGAIRFEDRFCASRMGGTGGLWVGVTFWMTVHSGCCSWP